MKLAETLSKRLGGNRDVAEQGTLLEQIEALSAANRRRGNPKRESRLVTLRSEAFSELERTVPETSPEMLAEVPESAHAYEIVDGLPTVVAAELSAELIRAAFLRYGCLMVRGLIDRAAAARLQGSLDRAFEGRDAYLEGAKAAKTAPWFQPFSPDEKYGLGGNEWNRHVKGGGSVWAADSPRVMFELLEEFERADVPALAAEYLGERPVFSMKKAVLRRVSADSGAAWHQDGAFLGENIRTLNVWVALTDCGVDAPGMDIVAERLSEIVPTGTEGSLFDWAVSDQLVNERLGDKIVRPVFEPGDSLLFDHLCLHRTAATPEMSKLRYATETWCFAPSTYPDKQIPIVV